MATLTLSRLRSLLEYDPVAGIFTRKHSRPGCAKNKRCGWTHKRGYRYIRVDGSQYFEHRLVWFYCNGVWPEDQIDHINGDKGDNRISNLRVVDNGLNQVNARSAQANNRLGVRGVHQPKRSRKYRAQIGIDKKIRWLGDFKTIEEASSAYQQAQNEILEACHG